ncbi:hypothetical protein LBMAG42_47700 [Deltaproteobacteria bacterium]|nr:hypothetical protein LBMAG42_47700 [Deltaproteobacteria bacterium]
MNRRIALLLLALVAPLAWTLTRPADFDEANFLTLARGALADPWRPHNILINWQGTTEPAFAVLSNPPGIAWWLAPVLSWPTWAMRLWMLPWLALAGWGAVNLGKRFLGDGETGALVLLTSPIVILSTTALLPDAPLYAVTLAGMAGYIAAVERGSGSAPWALLLGFAACFRYSGIALWPLAFLWPFVQRRPAFPAFAVVIPMALLAAHDVAAYGKVHVFAMGAFQSVANTPAEWGHKAVTALTMLGGAVVLPAYRWRGQHAAAAVVGALLAAPWGFVAMGFGALGGAALAPVVEAILRPAGTVEAAARPAADRIFLLSWAFLGVVFLLTLRFGAARYWLPFLAPVALLLPGDSPRLRLALSFGLGVLLAADGALQARGSGALAARAASLGTGTFVGHWGWQAALEGAGWSALDEGATPAPGTLVAIPSEAWPQRVNVRCDHVRWEGHAWPPVPWLPRSYSHDARANLHANWMAGPAPTSTVVPWWFAADAYEHARVCEE